MRAATLFSLSSAANAAQHHEDDTIYTRSCRYIVSSFSISASRGTDSGTIPESVPWRGVVVLSGSAQAARLRMCIYMYICI